LNDLSHTFGKRFEPFPGLSHGEW